MTPPSAIIVGGGLAVLVVACELVQLRGARQCDSP